MGALLIDIAQALVTELNAAAPGSFTQTFTAVRGYCPQFDLAELKTLRVTVVPRKLELASLTRQSNQHDVSVDVAVQKKVLLTDVAQLDDLMMLVEQIGDYFRLRRLTALPNVLWLRTENLPVYIPEHLEEKQVFTSVLTLTFRVAR
ncbi:MAG: hypothetical protein HC898_11885 [Phycisphaerales bacterium]|nr:hypothetical protein [Phycisphaerales bacterium]